MIQVPKRIDGEFVEKLLEWASNNKVNDVAKLLEIDQLLTRKPSMLSGSFLRRFLAGPK